MLFVSSCKLVGLDLDLFLIQRGILYGLDSDTLSLNRNLSPLIEEYFCCQTSKSKSMGIIMSCQFSNHNTYE